MRRCRCVRGRGIALARFFIAAMQVDARTIVSHKVSGCPKTAADSCEILSCASPAGFAHFIRSLSNAHRVCARRSRSRARGHVPGVYLARKRISMRAYAFRDFEKRRRENSNVSFSVAQKKKKDKNKSVSSK